MIDQKTEQFLKRTLVAVIGTIDAHGRPRTAPIWYHWEDGAAYMFTDRSTLKWRNILRNPQASLCIDDRNPPYKLVSMDGPVEEVDRSVYQLIKGMALRYYGEKEGQAFADNYKDEPENVVAFKLTPRHVNAEL